MYLFYCEGTKGEESFFMDKISRFLSLFFLFSTLATAAASDDIKHTTAYISKTWSTLTRDMTQCRTFFDSKMKGKTSLYLPANFPVPDALKVLEKKCQVSILHLPQRIESISANSLSQKYASGLLYLPHPYIVPGGMFNEMYGWDSYFIIRGLIADQQLSMAKGMVENFFFEIDHYGGILNANRGYYLSRSQPPFLSAMVLSVYQAMKDAGNKDLVWLKNAYEHIKKDYALWVKPPHLANDTKLSRYYDFADGPILETKEMANVYYREAVKYFLTHPDESEDFLKNEKEDTANPLVFAIKLCLKKKLVSYNCLNIRHVTLTNRYYQGDRAIRESGLDITFRFGAFGAGTIDYAPADLNSLLYQAEDHMHLISRELGLMKESKMWRMRAKTRRQFMNQWMWNEKRGLFFDYNFRKNKQSNYEYLATFYPLWVGLATPEQAKAVRDNLVLFEQPGGLTASTFHSGAQWDYPFGWAPFELIVIEGLQRYGYHEDAERLTKAFINTIVENFSRDGTIREKYNVVAGSAKTSIKIGYPTNEVGFGWTNGVFLTLLKKNLSVR